MNDENQDDENNSEGIITAPNVQQGKPEARKSGVIDRRYCPTDLFGWFYYEKSNISVLTPWSLMRYSSVRPDSVSHARISITAGLPSDS